MFGQIDIINPSSLVNQLLETGSDNGFIPKISSKDFRLLQYKTRPLKGFILPEGFPHCCDNHKALFNKALDDFKKFPDCCDPHRKLLKAGWFNKTDYAYFPIKILLSYKYTHHCIDRSINNVNWYKEITDYIEYTFYSFGQLPDGFGCALGRNRYLDVIKNHIELDNSIPDHKKVALKKFIEEIDGSGESQETAESIDLNTLHSLYKDWLNLFPFQISFFKNVKAYCEKTIPILKGRPYTNMYTGISKMRTTTATELIDSLRSITTEILKQVNSAILFEQGRLDDPDQVLMDVIVTKRKMGLKKYENPNEFTQGYISIYSEWLSDEKEFLDSLIPIIQRKKELKPFVEYLIEGLLEMQRQDVKVQAIYDIKKNIKKDESGFRFFMKTFLKGGFLNGSLSAEELKGDGRIDLKITAPSLGEKIVEFKGWWNGDKKMVAQQICSYLTDANKEGYIIMINHTGKSISAEYKTLISSEINSCSSWQELQYGETAFTYYKSVHDLSSGVRKELYHLIFNVYSSVERNK